MSWKSFFWMGRALAKDAQAEQRRLLAQGKAEGRQQRNKAIVSLKKVIRRIKRELKTGSITFSMEDIENIRISIAKNTLQYEEMCIATQGWYSVELELLSLLDELVDKI